MFSFFLWSSIPPQEMHIWFIKQPTRMKKNEKSENLNDAVLRRFLLSLLLFSIWVFNCSFILCSKKKKGCSFIFIGATKRERSKERELCFLVFSSLEVWDSTHQSYNQQKPLWYINRFPIKDFDPETKINWKFGWRICTWRLCRRRIRIRTQSGSCTQGCGLRISSSSSSLGSSSSPSSAALLAWPGPLLISATSLYVHTLFLTLSSLFLLYCLSFGFWRLFIGRIF